MRSGWPPKLDKRQREKLAKLIIGRDPRQLRFAFALWTREMIAELIEREFGVVMSISAVGRMLRKMGLSTAPAMAGLSGKSGGYRSLEDPGSP